MIRTHLKTLPVEEFANTITHGFGLVLSIAGFAALIALALRRGEAIVIAGCLIYGLSLVVLYAASTMYHSAVAPEIKSVLRVLDHCGIYVLIAGSYTPFGMIVLRDSLGQNLLIALWLFAFVGVLIKVLFRDRFVAASVVAYVVMGWIGILAIQPLFNAIGINAVLLIIAGGIAYTFGVVFFAWTRFRHHHAIFHVFVLFGSIFHYAAVVLYVVPYSAKL